MSQAAIAAQSALKTVTDVMLETMHHVQVVDDKGDEHEVLLRSFVHGHEETIYLLDRLATLLLAANAQPGDMLMLSRDEHGPVVNLLSLSQLCCTLAQHLQVIQLTAGEALGV